MKLMAGKEVFLTGKKSAAFDAVYFYALTGKFFHVSNHYITGAQEGSLFTIYFI
ncbi:hypothetical protein LAD12857_04550 [Lacrimispora amygdalina]|uniref:Uncharacterized protein n=1 Tax=Lacrimispora amygdalina TaxID=253257 RepID=A0ABQ5M0S4_9FIRM